MNKRNITIISGLILLIIILFGIGFYFLKNNSSNIPTEELTPTQFVESNVKGNLGYQEPTTVVAIGTSGVLKGIYQKVENGVIYVQSEDGNLNKYPLTVEKVVLACTTQDLSSATELDYNQVTKVKISTPSKIGDLIPAGQSVVTFASDVNGTMRVDTVAMDASQCPSN